MLPLLLFGRRLSPVLMRGLCRSPLMAMRTSERMEREEEEEMMNRNKRKPKKANHGAR